jgi:hypothetical protein
MSDFNDDDDFTGSEGFKKLRKAFKDSATENKELKERLMRLEGRDRSISLNEELARRGLDRRVGKFYPKDREITAEAVDEWVEENRELFGVKEPDSSTSVPLTNLTPVEVQGYQYIQAIQAAEAATEMDFKSRLAAAESPEAVIEMMKTFGAQHTF